MSNQINYSEKESTKEESSDEGSGDVGATEEEESVYEDADSAMEEESFHSIPASTDLDDSLDRYESVETPPRRSGRERKPAKKFTYDKLGRPDWKTSVRIKRPKQPTK